MKEGGEGEGRRGGGGEFGSTKSISRCEGDAGFTPLS